MIMRAEGGVRIDVLVVVLPFVVEVRPCDGRGGDEGGAAAEVFRAIAARLVDEVAPPTNMAGCSARLLQQVSRALDERDAARAVDAERDGSEQSSISS